MRIFWIIDSVGDVQETVQEEKCHVGHVRGLAIHTRIVEGRVQGEFGAISTQGHADFRGKFWPLALLLIAFIYLFTVDAK